MKWLAGNLVVFVLFFLAPSLLIDVPYHQQVDSRKREYYPATVVDKSYYESCSKSSCRTYYTVVVELRKTGDYKHISATENAYHSAVVGQDISFERHITDPDVVQANEFIKVFALVGFVFFILWSFVRMDKWLNSDV